VELLEARERERLGLNARIARLERELAEARGLAARLRGEVDERAAEVAEANGYVRRLCRAIDEQHAALVALERAAGDALPS
jgi:chromosome segregation ATPase